MVVLAKRLVPTSFPAGNNPVGAPPPAVQVAPVMKYWLRTSFPGTCVVLLIEMISEFEAGVSGSSGLGTWLNAPPNAFHRMVSLGPIPAGWQFPVGVIFVVPNGSFCRMQLNGPAEPLAVNSHVPAVFWFTVLVPV